jgi:ATP-binding cassette subfamily B protein
VKISDIRKNHKQHHDQSDCGVVCLSTILSYYSSYYPIEELRQLSGTNKTGTTMLGLINCARTVGFDANGYEADINSLKVSKHVTILHIIKDKILQHYIVCFGYCSEKKLFFISDPADKTLRKISEENLEKLWKSKALVLLKPTEQLNVNNKKPRKYIWVFSFLKEDLNILSMAFLLGLIVAILGLSSAIFSQKFIDILLPSNDIEKVLYGGLLLLFLMLVSGFFGYVKQLFLLRQGRDFGIRVIDYFFNKLLQLPKVFFDSRKIGDLTARMNDTNRIQNTITSFVSNFIVNFLTFFVSSIAIFSYNWKLGIFSLLWLPLLVLIVWYYHPRIIVEQRKVMQSYSQNESNYIDTIKGIDTIKSSNKQSFFTAVTLGIFTNHKQNIYNLGKIGIQFQLVLQTIGAFFIVGLILLGSYLVFKGDFTSGGVIALIQLSSMLMGSAIGLASLNIELQEASIALNRMFEYTTIKTENLNSLTKLKSNIYSIRLNNIKFGFVGRQALLKNISINALKGECIGITGEIGSGKSTLINLLQKSYKPTKGEILVNDFSLTNITIQNWRQYVGIIPQDVHIFNGSILYNIGFDITDESIDKIIEFCEINGFSSFINKLPQGYFTIIGEEGINLSGGQKQIIALIRVLYRRPKLLLLDEFTSSMDRKTEKFALRLLNNLKNEIIIFFISHRIQSFPHIADRIYIIEDGIIAHSGDHKELMETDNYYSNFWSELSNNF